MGGIVENSHPLRDDTPDTASQETPAREDKIVFNEQTNYVSKGKIIMVCKFLIHWCHDAARG